MSDETAMVRLGAACGGCVEDDDVHPWCDHGLLPLGGAPVVPCVEPLGHEGPHRTPRGAKWVDPADEDDS